MIGGIILDRSQILKESGDLFDRDCKGCKKWMEAANQKHHRQAQEYCETKCSTGKRLLELGDHLSYGSPTKIGRDLIKEVYLEEQELGLMDKDIAKKHGISAKVLWRRKVFWGLTTIKSKRHFITKEQYLSRKEKKQPDWYIAEKVGLHINSLVLYKKSWGIKNTTDLNTITEGPNGEEISFDSFTYYKSLGWTDGELASHWGIGKSTLTRKKNAWKLCGYDVDKYNVYTIRGALADGN
jgi:hypothetical protein